MKHDPIEAMETILYFVLESLVCELHFMFSYDIPHNILGMPIPDWD